MLFIRSVCVECVCCRESYRHLPFQSSRNRVTQKGELCVNPWAADRPCERKNRPHKNQCLRPLIYISLPPPTPLRNKLTRFLRWCRWYYFSALVTWEHGGTRTRYEVKNGANFVLVVRPKACVPLALVYHCPCFPHILI